MASFADQKKQILPYLQRADEIQALDPKVAYYCRVFALQQGILIEDRLPEIQGVLEALMSKVEQDRKKLSLTDTDKDHCEAFAINVFNRADKQDRSGKADHNTVRAFYVATVFIQILSQFGELPQDLVEKMRYAGWKAADIRKAMREGRTPTPGPAEQPDFSLDLPNIPGAAGETTVGASQDLDLPTPPSAFNSAAAPKDPPTLTGPGVGASASGGAQGPGFQQNRGPQPTLPGQKFLPGNKVYYNAYDGSLLKGTVASLIQGTPGPSYQVALSAKVIDIREERLAHDFDIGDAALLSQADGSTTTATVTKVDATRWPVAYLLTLENGSLQPAVAASLTPLILPGGSRPDESSLAPGGRPSGQLSGPPEEGPPTNRADLGSTSNAGPADLPKDSFYPGIDHQQASGSNFQGEGNQSFPNIDLHQHSGFDTAHRSGGGGGGNVWMNDTAHSRDSSLGQGPVVKQAPDESARSDSPGNAPIVPPPDVPPGARSSLGGPHTSSSPPKAAGYPGSPKKPPQDPPQGFSWPPGGCSGSAGGQPGFSFNQSLSSVQPGGNLAPHQSAGQGLPGSASSSVIQPAPVSFQPSATVINEAHKVTKTALSALSFEDVPTALQYLNKAIEMLTRPDAKK